MIVYVWWDFLTYLFAFLLFIHNSNRNFYKKHINGGNSLKLSWCLYQLSIQQRTIYVFRSFEYILIAINVKSDESQL